MIQKKFLVALGALSAAVAACGSDMTGSGPNGGDGDGDGNTSGSGGSSAGNSGASGASGANGGTGASSGAGGTSGASGASGAGGGGGVRTCTPGVPSTSQVRRMTNHQYDTVVKDLLGVTTLTSAGNNPPSFLLAEDSDGSLTDIAWSAYQSTADKIAAEVMAGANRSKFIACDPAMANCLSDTIRAFGRKAFRRPLTAAEVTSFERLNMLTPRGTPAEVAEAILYAFLTSPSFIMVPELAQEAEGTSLKLSSHEVAARLSFMLWDSVPDETLSMAADMNQLATKDQILEQATRMIMLREKTAPVVAAYHRFYADIRLGSHWNGITHDAAKYPKWNANVPAPMMAEIDRFFEEVAFQGGSFKDIFLSNVAYVTRDTAPIYGLDAASYGAEPARVELDATQRPGFLTRVGFLASFSAGGSTSPILRGAYISKNILGVHIDDPPPGAADTPVPPGNYMTQREVVTALTAGDMCAGCHAGAINPWGFVLESFDSIGGIQATDPLGGAIDSTATVEINGSEKTLSTPIELMTEIGLGPDAKHRYAEKWVVYATGRVPNDNDACLVNDLDLKLSQDGYTILNVLADLTQADSFRLRTVGN
jgi:hypothetical protein